MSSVSMTVENRTAANDTVNEKFPSPHDARALKITNPFCYIVLPSTTYVKRTYVVHILPKVFVYRGINRTIIECGCVVVWLVQIHVTYSCRAFMASNNF